MLSVLYTSAEADASKAPRSSRLMSGLPSTIKPMAEGMLLIRDESQRARHRVPFSGQIIHFAEGGERGEDDDAHGGAEQGLRNLHQAPTPIEAR